MMRMRTAAVMLATLLIAAASMPAEEVRILESAEDWAVVGTDDFSLRIDRTGAIGKVMVGETEYSWLIRLYTTPVVPETGEGLRAVQGEGGRSLGPPPEQFLVEQRGEIVCAIIRQVAARDEIYQGEPLYNLTQIVTIHPSGLVNLRYEFDWLRLLDFKGASLIMALRAAALDGCRWWAEMPPDRLGGIISAAPEARSLDAIKGPMRTFVARCEGEELHLWVNESGRVTAPRWNPDDYAFTLQVPHTGHEGSVYAGLQSVIDVDLKLPVPREDEP